MICNKYTWTVQHKCCKSNFTKSMS